MLDLNAESYLNNLLIHHDYLLQQYQHELNTLPAGELGVRAGNGRKGTPQYCRYLNGDRIGITHREDLITKLARKKYLREAIKSIDNNRKHLKKLIVNYKNINSQDIIARFPHHYAILMDKEQMEWNMRKHQWQAAPYDQSTFRLHEKTHVTARALHVRSKSEVIVAERLDYYGIPYRYEQMLYIDQYRLAPDFTILTKKGLMYWEHCGLIDDPGYVRKQNWKNSMYAKAGIVPWRNYITTYDDEEGNFNSRIIESEIINKILPYC